MRVLITGALGFIGSHLADEYIARGHTVFGIDNRSGNVLDRVDGMESVWHQDVRHIERSGYRPDLVVHAASPVGAVALITRGESIVAEIVETTQAVIRYCQRRRLPLINISSSEVYGFSGVYHEYDSCIVPPELTHRLQYAAGKLAGEQLVRTSGLAAVNVRPFNVAGPRQSREKGFVLPTFCEQALAGEPLTVFDRGTQERSFTAVWDLVRFIADCDPHGCPDVVNVGNPGNRTTVLALAERVGEILGRPVDIEFTTGKAIHGPDYEEAKGIVKVPDATVAARLGWHAEVGLDEMVARTAAEIVEVV